jgi:hypothetical protein
MKHAGTVRCVLLCFGISLVGCAAAPTGPKFTEMTLPRPPQDKAMIVVYREYAEPTSLAGKIDVDGTQIFELPQKGFAHEIVEPGKHLLALRWPAASGTPGWQGDAEWSAGQTYYYQLRGAAGHGWHFQSALDLSAEGVAVATMRDCCRLITAKKDQAVLAGNVQAASASKRDIEFERVKAEMTPEEVTAAIGAPDHVSSDSTGKGAVPFYFGTDTRRVSWSYTGAGFVVFSRNAYTGTLHVVETKRDSAAP